MKAHIDKTRREAIGNLKDLETSISSSKKNLINIGDINTFKSEIFDKIAATLVELVANQVKICMNREIDDGLQNISLTGYYHEGFTDLGISTYGKDNLYYNLTITSEDETISGDYSSSEGRIKENRPYNEPFMNFVEDMLFLINKLVELLEKKIQKK